jgi:hypothetical protein
MNIYLDVCNLLMICYILPLIFTYLYIANIKPETSDRVTCALECHYLW